MQLNDDWSNCKECPPLYSIAQQQLPFSPLHNTAPPPTKKSTKEAGLLKSEKKAHLESKQSPSVGKNFVCLANVKFCPKGRIHPRNDGQNLQPASHKSTHSPLSSIYRSKVEKIYIDQSMSI